ncbi:MAG: hypothetical protein HQL56_14275 [Magnetococcales bacterium]|nr:hypothetical protein [Magnetococcales bacterium]
MALLTGVRRSNVCSMRWDEIKLERAVWRIPETKNGSPSRSAGARRNRDPSRAEGVQRKRMGPSPSPRSATGHLVDRARPGNASWNGSGSRMPASTICGAPWEAGRPSPELRCG